MDDRLKRMEGRLDQVGETLHAIDKTLDSQARSLRDHMRRTAANEKRQTLLEKQLHRELLPVKRHVEGINYLLKAVGVATILLSFAFSALKFTHLFTASPPKGEKRHGQMSALQHAASERPRK